MLNGIGNSISMENIKVGTIAYAAHSGLGILAKDFYDNEIINKVILCPHSTQGVNSGFYPKESTIIDLQFNPPGSRPDFLSDKVHMDILEEFFKEIDVLFLFETIFWRNAWHRLSTMKNRPKIILMPMYESTPFKFNEELNIYPDMLLCSSKLDYNFYKHHKWHEKGVDIRLINVPVSIPWKQRTKAIHFVHNGGNGSYADRNGTALLTKAIPYIKSPIKLTINSQISDHQITSTIQQYQAQLKEFHKTTTTPMEINFNNNKTIDYEDLWSSGDVFVFPERFNALSLPLQEARAAGMYVIAGNRFPINKWLPLEGLIPVTGYKNVYAADGVVASAQYQPQDLANKIDKVYNTDITQYSKDGLKYAEKNSWKCLRPKYKEHIQSVLE